MKPVPDEKQIEELLANSALQTGSQLDRRLSNAPWTTRAVARRRFASVASIVALFLALTIAITPQGRAFAQSFLGLFLRAEGDTIPVPTSQPMNWVALTPGMPQATLTPVPTITPIVAFYQDCGSFPVMSCSVEQIRSKVNFSVKEPASIPSGMYFTGATGGPDAIYLRYEYENNRGGLFITEERWTGTPDQGNPRVGASALIEEVKVGGLTGEYYRGSFIQNGNSQNSIATWNPDETSETLRWVDDGISYTLQYYFTDQGYWGKERLAAIAENMTTEPVPKTPMPATPEATATRYVSPDLLSLKIALAERQAGFKLMLPPSLPGDLTTHGGASFNRGTGVASIWFTYDDVNMNGLYINQQIISDPTDCALCGAIVGNDNSVLLVHGPEIVGADANLETVRIGDMTGKYYTGVRLGSGEWDPMPDMEHLRWQVDGRALELISLGTDLQKEDLIRIAESLK
jgi:hypothetical protein